MRRSTIVDTTARLVFHSALVLSLYLVLAGHNQPGGGFAGGLVAGAAVAAHYLAGGTDQVRSLLRVRPWIVVGTGLALSAGTALVPVLVGGALLESERWDIAAPVLGSAKVTTTTVFDIGVYLIVVGLVAMIFEGFGEEANNGEEHR